MVLAQGGLPFQQAGEELGVGPLAGGGLAHQVLGVIAHVGELEFVETAAQLVGAGVFTLAHGLLLSWGLRWGWGPV